MKRLTLFVVAAAMGLSAFSQMNLPVNNLFAQEPETDSLYLMNPNTNYPIQQIDSNTEYKHLKEGLVVQGGHVKVIRNGYAFKMRGSFPFKNGAVLFPDGMIKMPDGSSPALDEKNYMDFDGHIKPLR